MDVYRIVKSAGRINDMSGTGAFRAGGRWNNKGTYMLYTSENSSLAYLENLVHFNASEFPPNLYILKIELNDVSPVYELPDSEYPEHWTQIGHMACKTMGDKWMFELQWLAIKIKSGINILEYNYLLNPLFPYFHEFVKIIKSSKIMVDERLIN
ncbi:MAG: RES domain-containing protein [Chitinophagaceae bacterium]|nr:RES domain-containing protein [Chitinophagaceae bacterium]